MAMSRLMIVPILYILFRMGFIIFIAYLLYKLVNNYIENNNKKIIRTPYDFLFAFNIRLLISLSLFLFI